MAGIARENFNRILADWKRRKLVSRLAGLLASRIRPCWKKKPTFRAAGRYRPRCRWHRAKARSVMICPSATKSTLRGDVRRQARPMVRAGCGCAKRSSFHALVAHFDAGGNPRHQRDAIAVRHHLHHGGEDWWRQAA